MMLKLKYGLFMLLLTIFFSDIHAQKNNPWKKGILVDEFIYDTAPFPQCHAATIAETPKGLVVAFFGGTKERNPDVEIWVCRQENGHLTKAPVCFLQDQSIRRNQTIISLPTMFCHCPTMFSSSLSMLTDLDQFYKTKSTHHWAPGIKPGSSKRSVRCR